MKQAKKPDPLKRAERKYKRKSGFRGKKLAHQHGSDGDVPLLSTCHTRTSLVGFVDRSNDEYVEYDHDETGNDSHEYEIGQQNVVLNVSRIRT